MPHCCIVIMVSRIVVCARWAKNVRYPSESTPVDLLLECPGSHRTRLPGFPPRNRFQRSHLWFRFSEITAIAALYSGVPHFHSALVLIFLLHAISFLLGQRFHVRLPARAPVDMPSPKPTKKGFGIVVVFSSGFALCALDVCHDQSPLLLLECNRNIRRKVIKNYRMFQFLSLSAYSAIFSGCMAMPANGFLQTGLSRI